MCTIRTSTQSQRQGFVCSHYTTHSIRKRFIVLKPFKTYYEKFFIWLNDSRYEVRTRAYTVKGCRVNHFTNRPLDCGVEDSNLRSSGNEPDEIDHFSNPQTPQTGADPAISTVTGWRLCCLSSRANTLIELIRKVGLEPTIFICH